MIRHRFPISCMVLCLVVFTRFEILGQRATTAGQYPPELVAGLRWRDAGPMRAGRSFGVAGHADQPDTFYFGSVGGGVWKTENSGRSWYPIGDEGIPIGSIGTVAVAPSNPNIVYVGTGEPDIRSQHSYGIGMFKSTDAGKTWMHAGLEDTRQIGRVVIDPTNANRVYVAALGHVYDANPDRGVFRSTDGGANWKKFCSRVTMWGRSTLPSIRKILACCMRPCGRRAGRHGQSTRRRICPAADCTNPPTAATPGSN
jgi:photosystem II stability/assembly factor-like uncharacterized protein